MEMLLRNAGDEFNQKENLFASIHTRGNNHVLVARRPYFDLDKIVLELRHLSFSKINFELHDYEEKVRLAFSLIKDKPLSRKASEFVIRLEADTLSLIGQSFEITSLHRPYEVSLSFIQDVPCTKLHADFLPLRLLCTYFGAGTVFLPPSSTRYSCLNQGSANKRVVVKGAEVLEARPFEVLLLKGRKFEGGELKPCAHRSPEINGTDIRLLLKVDFK